EPHPVFASAAKQSTSQTTRRSTMDCHVATLLAETALHRLPRPSASQRQKRVIANPTPSLRAQRSNPPRKPREARHRTTTSLLTTQRQHRIDIHGLSPR